MKLLGYTKVAHRYLMNGQPKNCANPQCREPLRGEVYRVGEQYFCGEICIEATPQRKYQ